MRSGFCMQNDKAYIGYQQEWDEQCLGKYKLGLRKCREKSNEERPYNPCLIRAFEASQKCPHKRDSEQPKGERHDMPKTRMPFK